MDADSASEQPTPKRIDPGETILSVAVILFGVAMIWQTREIRLTPAYSLVGPRVIPYIVSGGLILVGAWLLFEALTGRWILVASTESEDADPTLPTDWSTVGLLALALLAYLFLLVPAGFVIASSVLFAGAAFAMGSRRVALNLAIGVVISVVLYLGFTRGLDLRLPAGVLEGIV